MKNIGPLFAAVILALVELTSILRTRTQLELWEWSFIVVLFIAFFAGAIAVAKIAELGTDRILKTTWRQRLDSTAFATGTAIAFWMTIFSWLPFFGLSMLKNGGISAGLSPLFIGVTIAAAGVALASLTYQWKRQKTPNKVQWAALFVWYTVLVSEWTFSSAKTAPVSYLHLAISLALILMGAKLIKAKIKEALAYSVLLPIALALLIFAPNRIAHTAAERTTIVHHVQYATSSFRPEIQTEECAFQANASLVKTSQEIDSVVLVILDTIRADVIL